MWQTNSSARRCWRDTWSLKLQRPEESNLPQAVVVQTSSDAADLAIIRAEEEKAAKRWLKLAGSFKKGYTTMFDQCSQEVKDKAEATHNWEMTQRGLLLHDLICKIERICVGFDDHKQEVLHLIHALNMFFFYSQTDKETMEEYPQNIRSL
jgi:hypothetical protein